jgi:hypothetical protein
MKVSELTGAALDWAVAKCIYKPDEIVCEGRVFVYVYIHTEGCFSPSENWAHGGPIIEREGISLDKMYDTPDWCASMENTKGHTAPTPLIAAMRCYVASKLGDEIEVPNELFREV